MAVYYPLYNPPIPIFENPVVCLPGYYNNGLEVCLPSLEAQEIVWTQIRQELATLVEKKDDIAYIRHIMNGMDGIAQHGYPELPPGNGWTYDALPPWEGEGWYVRPPVPLQPWVSPLRVLINNGVYNTQTAILSLGASLGLIGGAIARIALVALAAVAVVALVWSIYDFATDPLLWTEQQAPVPLPPNVDSYPPGPNPVIQVPPGGWPIIPEGGLPVIPGSLFPGGGLQRLPNVVIGDTPEAIAGYQKFQPKGLFVQNATANFFNSYHPNAGRPSDPGIPVYSPAGFDDAPYGFGCSAYGTITIKYFGEPGNGGAWYAKNWDGTNLEWVLLQLLTPDDLPLGEFTAVPNAFDTQVGSFTIVQLG